MPLSMNRVPSSLESALFGVARNTWSLIAVRLLDYLSYLASIGLHRLASRFLITLFPTVVLLILESLCSVASPSEELRASGNSAFRIQGRGSELAGWIIDEQRLDPCLGIRWQRWVNRNHPEWPGRLTLIERPLTLLSIQNTAYQRAAPIALETSPLSALPLVIHAGDIITVVQDSTAVRARFEAEALESAALGESLKVRLGTSARTEQPSRPRSFDGAVVIVRATGAGESEWLNEIREEPR